MGSDATLSLATPESRLHVKGDLNISSTQTAGNQMTAGVIEIGGDIRSSEYASSENFSLKGTKLVLNGTEKQQVILHYDPDRAPYEIDMTQSAGVAFWESTIHAKSIKGFDKILNSSICIKDLQQELERDEIFYGDLSIAGKSLKLAGHNLEVTGSLKVYDTVLTPDKGLV